MFGYLSICLQEAGFMILFRKSRSFRFAFDNTGTRRLDPSFIGNENIEQTSKTEANKLLFLRPHNQIATIGIQIL